MRRSGKRRLQSTLNLKGQRLPYQTWSKPPYHLFVFKVLRRNASSGARKKNTPVSALQAPMAGKTRTVYFGGIPIQTTVTDICNRITGGSIESVRILKEKSCAFVDFFDEASALNFFRRYEANGSHFIVLGKDLKVSWANPSASSDAVQRAIKNGATRNVYVGNLDCTRDSAERLREALRKDFETFGPVDMVKVVPERKIAFVHMASVSAAIQAVNMLPSNSRYAERKLSFGSDRCGERPPPGVHPSLAIKRSLSKVDEGPSEEAEKTRSDIPETYRTIYLGDLPAGTSISDICDVIRGGLLQNIRKSEEKRCAFVSFVDEASAEGFSSFFSHYGFFLKGQPVKIGWAKPTPASIQVANALQKGATRNLYIGQVEVCRLGDDPKAALQRLCEDRFGPVDTVNVLPAKNMAFVHFCNLLDAVKAVTGFQQMTEFANCKLGYGKDRCAQPLRPPFLAPSFPIPPPSFVAPSHNHPPQPFYNPHMHPPNYLYYHLPPTTPHYAMYPSLNHPISPAPTTHPSPINDAKDMEKALSAISIDASETKTESTKDNSEDSNILSSTTDIT